MDSFLLPAVVRDGFHSGEPLAALCRSAGFPIRDALSLLPIRMPQYVVSARHVYEYWPIETHEAILDARDSYDAGLVEMTQAKVCNHFILYAIPRTRPAKNRRPYFRANTGDLWA